MPASPEEWLRVRKLLDTVREQLNRLIVADNRMPELQQLVLQAMEVADAIAADAVWTLLLRESEMRVEWLTGDYDGTHPASPHAEIRRQTRVDQIMGSHS